MRGKSLHEWLALVGPADSAGTARRFLRETLERLDDLEFDR